MENKDHKILSIIAYDRSGTTFLGKLLNSYNGTFFFGELDRGVSHYNSGTIKQCACGEDMANCNVWKGFISNNKFKSPNKKFFENVADKTDSHILIDSSKGFDQIKYFDQLYGDNQLIIHLLRNPKGVIFSRMKTRKRRVQNGSHPKMHIAKHTNLLMIYDCLEWCLENIWFENFKKKKKLVVTAYYDRLDKEYALKILPFLYLNSNIAKGSFKSDLDNHMLFGNINRFKPVVLPIYVDTQWKEGLSFFQKMVVDVITFPIRFLYKYNFKQ